MQKCLDIIRLSSERGIAWRAADSLVIRRFVHLGLQAGQAMALPQHLRNREQQGHRVTLA